DVPADPEEGRDRPAILPAAAGVCFREGCRSVGRALARRDGDGDEPARGPPVSRSGDDRSEPAVSDAPRRRLQGMIGRQEPNRPPRKRVETCCTVMMIEEGESWK